MAIDSTGKNARTLFRIVRILGRTQSNCVTNNNDKNGC